MSDLRKDIQKSNEILNYWITRAKASGNKTALQECEHIKKTLGALCPGIK